MAAMRPALWTVSGRQRRLGEHERLLSSAGFRLQRVVPTTSDVTLLEAVPE
jgi:hypothetical protein